MTNPFGSRLDADGLQHISMSHAESEYAAHAINQHDKLVAMINRIATFGFSFDPRDQQNGAYRDAVRGIERDAKALLAEETEGS